MVLHRCTLNSKFCTFLFGDLKFLKTVSRTMKPASNLPVCSNKEVISTTNNEIIKSASDLRHYRGLKLSNNMKVMLVSDPLTDKAAASMDINIGSLCDPDNLPGLAHFCEHMLFLGTSKYPNEDEYQKFINQHAGSCNAFTSEEHTNYFFDIGHEHLREILDRFAQFFLSPLFDASCTDREVNAVNSEHEKNIMSDTWRLLQLEKSTCDPNHKSSRFSTGNKDTLDTIPKANGISVRDELLKYHSKFYSANVMGLAVLGKESLDELEEMVVELFGAIENMNVECPSYESPYRKEDLQKITFAVPIKDVRNLFLRFPIPDCTDLYKTSPTGYLAHLIGHEGPGSLLSELKKLGWVNSLSAGSEGGCKGYDSFVIIVDLTEDGMVNIDDIITRMFEYIEMLRKHDVQEWIFEEIKELNSLNFRFRDKERPTSCVMNISSSLHDFPLEDVLSAGILLSEYKPDLIRMIMDCLVPTNLRIVAVAKEFEPAATETEKWYGTKYHIENLPEEQIAEWSQAGANPNFSLPLRNEFIPADFVISPLSNEHSPIPVSIKKEKLSQVWYKQDDQFKLPKACLMFELFSPTAYTDANRANQVYMFSELFKDALNEYAYAAELAGLKYRLKNSVYGIQIEIRGYHDKQKVLVEKIFRKMASFEVDPKRFEIIKEMYLRVLKNFEAEQPYQQAVFFSHALRREKAWLKSDLLEALPSLTCEQMLEFIPYFMSNLKLEILVHGNIIRSDALKLSDLVEDILKQDAGVKPPTELESERYREVCVPRGSSYVYQYRNKVRDINATNLFLQMGLQNTHENTLLMLLEQIINEPCFNVLRTKENLGYIVASKVVVSNCVQGLIIIVQSERSPDYLEQRIEAFLNHVEKLLEEMPASDFNDHVAALVARILEKPKKLVTESLKYWAEILTEQLQFKRPEIEAKHLKTLKKEDLQKFYKEYIHIDGPKRAKLVTHILARDLKECPTTPSVQNEENSDFFPCPPLKESIVIDDFASFKRDLSLYPRVSPQLENLPEKFSAAL